MTATSTLSAAEQYMLELINRARLDPAAEALRLGVQLNAGLALNTINATAKQVLAPNQLLENAATSHAQWMLNTDTFSHTGVNGSSAGGRATDAGYQWNWLGENIQWMGSTAAISLNALISKQHDALFISALHRANLMNSNFSEIGVAQEAGLFQSGAHNFNAAMVAQSFGTAGDKFVTGVSYNDINKDGMYSIGEAVGGVQFRATDNSLGTQTLDANVTGAAGGYTLAANATGTATVVTGNTATYEFGAVVDTSAGNAKLDVVNGTTLATSANAMLLDGWFTGDQVLEVDLTTLIDEYVTVGSGTVNNLKLLGAGNLMAVGSNLANLIDGNKGANSIYGNAGNDTINGNAGADTLSGDNGADILNGGSGNDALFGGEGGDDLNGYFGLDRISGGDGADVLRGGLDKDTFIFNAGDDADMIADFSVRAKERLELDDGLWADAGTLTKAQVVSTYAHVVSGTVVFNFGDGDILTLAGVKSLSGLAALIDII